MEIDEKIDQNLLTLATGFIVDEIPQDLIESYMEYMGGRSLDQILTKNNYL